MGNQTPLNVMVAKSMVLSSRDLGKAIQLDDGIYLIDVAKNPFMRNQLVYLFISGDGRIEPVAEGMKFKNKYMVKRESEGITPPSSLYSFTDIAEAPAIPLKEAFNIAKEVLRQTVVFKDEKIYDLVVAWNMYTWVRGLFPKNINLYFIGFPGTGKSQALKFCKLFSRYVVDYDPTAEKSYKWNISSTLGVIAIDEAEYISKIQASKLRKYHETNVIETRLVGLPLMGLTSIDLRVDAPLVLASTHPPADTAFLQRGLIIRMYKGSPEIKDFNLISDLDVRRLIFMKSVITNWFKILLAQSNVYAKLSSLNIDERIKDLVLPIATILELLGFEWDWVIDYAKYSFTQANFITPETTAFIQSLIIIKDKAKMLNGSYVLPLKEVSNIMEALAETLGANPSRLNYLRQYLFAGCEVKLVNNELSYVCDRNTVESLLRNVEVLGDGEQFTSGNGNTTQKVYKVINVISEDSEVKEKYITVNQFRKIVKVSKLTVLRWIWKGKIKAVKAPSGKWLIPYSEVLKIVGGEYNKGEEK